jgi:hypothetical protein
VIGDPAFSTAIQRVVIPAPTESRCLHLLNRHFHHLEKSEQAGRRTAYVINLPHNTYLD